MNESVADSDPILLSAHSHEEEIRKRYPLDFAEVENLTKIIAVILKRIDSIEEFKRSNFKKYEQRLENLRVEMQDKYPHLRQSLQINDRVDLFQAIVSVVTNETIDTHLRGRGWANSRRRN